MLPKKSATAERNIEWCSFVIIPETIFAAGILSTSASIEFRSLRELYVGLPYVDKMSEDCSRKRRLSATEANAS